MRAFVSAAAVLFLSGIAVGQEAGERILVSVDNAQLRVQASILAYIPKGTILTVNEVRGDWVFVTYVSSRTRMPGWVARRDLLSMDKAGPFIDEELRRQPTAELYHIRAQIRSERGEHDAALTDCNEALRLDPNRAYFWNTRGNIWRSKGDTVKAIGDLNQAIRLDPGYQAAYKNRGNVWSDRGAFDKAVVDFTEALRLDPKDIDALNNRGNMWMQQKNYDRAIADWNEVMRVEPRSSTAYNNLAWLLATCEDEQHRNPRRAVELATKACELGGWKNAGDIDTLATAYSALGDLENAVKWQTKALELAPERKKAAYEKTLEQYRSAQAAGDTLKN